MEVQVGAILLGLLLLAVQECAVCNPTFHRCVTHAWPRVELKEHERPLQDPPAEHFRQVECLFIRTHTSQDWLA